jgi:hypothetical protein
MGLASLAPGLALVADLRGSLARDVPPAFGFAILSDIIRSFC